MCSINLQQMHVSLSFAGTYFCPSVFEGRCHDSRSPLVKNFASLRRCKIMGVQLHFCRSFYVLYMCKLFLEDSVLRRCSLVSQFLLYIYFQYACLDFLYMVCVTEMFKFLGVSCRDGLILEDDPGSWVNKEREIMICSRQSLNLQLRHTTNLLVL